MKILLPAQFTENAISDFLSKVIHDGKPRYPSVRYDFSNLKFIDPVGQTTLSNTIGWLKKRDVKQKVTNHKSNSAAIRYLDDSKFFETHLKSHKSLSPSANLRDTTLPLMRVNHNRADNWLRDDFIRWMSQRTQIPEEALSSIKSSLMEIFINMKDHSEEGVGCCSAQHFPKKKEVLLAISDFGVGIPSQMSKKFKGSDNALIIKACKEGISTKSVPQNRGAGLHLLVKNIVELNSGYLSIYSNSGLIKFSNDNMIKQRYTDSFNNYYPGTLFVVTFRTDTLIRDELEDFEWF